MRGLAGTIELRGLRRSWRVWRRFAALSVSQLLEYRLNVLFSTLQQAGQLALLAVVYLVMFQYVPVVGGWSRSEALLLLGVAWTFEGTWSFIFARSLNGLSGLVRRGELDFVLLRPLAPQVLVACWRGTSPGELGRALQGALLTLYAGTRAGLIWQPQSLLVALLFGLCGLSIYYALRFAIASCAFWIVQVEEVHELVETVTETSRYPVTFFPPPLQALLTYIIPVAYLATFPAQALLGRADLRFLPVGVVLALVALFASSRLWGYGLRSYTSAGG
jgi:ABC-2 type transport system permease protein